MTGRRAALRAGRWRRTAFAAYIFVPAMLLFALPPLFFRIPMAVLLYNRVVHASARDVGDALLVCLVWFAVALGLFFCRAGADRETFRRDWSPRARWWVFWGCSTLGCAVALANTVVMLPAAVEEIAVHLAFAPVIGVVLGMWILRGDATAAAPLALRALVGAAVVADLAVGLAVPVLASRVGPAVFGLIAILYGLTVTGVGARKVLAGVLALAVLVAVGVPLKEFLRERVYNATGAGHAPAVVRRVLPRLARTPAAPGSLTFGERIQRFDQWGTENGLRFGRAPGPFLVAEFAVARVAERIDRLGDLAYVIGRTPSAVPYAGVATYAPLAGTLVPRAVWRSKPADLAGQFYGHRYAFLDPRDTSHSDNLPVITEAWMSGGWPAVVLSAAFLGLLLRLVWRYWIGESDAAGNVVIGMVVVAAAADMESNLSLVVGGVVHGLVIYWALDAAVRYWDARRAAVTARVTPA